MVTVTAWWCQGQCCQWWCYEWGGLHTQKLDGWAGWAKQAKSRHRRHRGRTEPVSCDNWRASETILKKKCMSLPNHEIMVRPWLYMVYGCLQNPEVDNRWVQYGTVWFISWSMGFTEVESQVIRLDTITAFTWGLNPGSSSFHANFDGQNHQISKNNAFKQFDHESIILAISQILLLHSQKVCPLNSHLFIRFEGQRQKKSTHQDKVTNSDSMFGKFGEWHVLNNPWFLQASGQKKAF